MKETGRILEEYFTMEKYGTRNHDPDITSLAEDLVEALSQHRGFDEALENCPDHLPLQKHYEQIIKEWKEENL